jgi:hypothetical protein
MPWKMMMFVESWKLRIICDFKEIFEILRSRHGRLRVWNLLLASLHLAQFDSQPLLLYRSFCEIFIEMNSSWPWMSTPTIDTWTRPHPGCLRDVVFLQHSLLISNVSSAEISFLLSAAHTSRVSSSFQFIYRLCERYTPSRSTDLRRATYLMSCVLWILTNIRAGSICLFKAWIMKGSPVFVPGL